MDPHFLLVHHNRRFGPFTAEQLDRLRLLGLLPKEGTIVPAPEIPTPRPATAWSPPPPPPDPPAKAAGSPAVVETTVPPVLAPTPAPATLPPAAPGPKADLADGPLSASTVTTPAAEPEPEALARVEGGGSHSPAPRPSWSGLWLLVGLVGGGMLMLAVALLAAKLLQSARTAEAQRVAEQADRELREGNLSQSLESLRRLAAITGQTSNVWYRIGQVTTELASLEDGGSTAAGAEGLRPAERDRLIRGVIFVEALTNALLVADSTNTTDAALRLLDKASAQEQDPATVEAVRTWINDRARRRGAR